MSRGSSWPRRKRQGLVESRSHAGSTNEEKKKGGSERQWYSSCGGMGGGHCLSSYSCGSAMRRVEPEGKRNLAFGNPEKHFPLITRKPPTPTLISPWFVPERHGSKECVHAHAQVCVPLICQHSPAQQKASYILWGCLSCSHGRICSLCATGQ